MKRELQGRYVTLSTVGEKAQAFVPAPLTAQKRNRLFSYAGYIEIMSRGTELPGR